jgi:hypothetical protein
MYSLDPRWVKHIMSIVNGQINPFEHHDSGGVELSFDGRGVAFPDPRIQAMQVP